MVEGVLNVACFKEIRSAANFDSIICIYSNPTTKKVALEPDVRANSATSTRKVKDRFGDERQEKPRKSEPAKMGGIYEAYRGFGRVSRRKWLLRWIRWEVGVAL